MYEIRGQTDVQSRWKRPLEKVNSKPKFPTTPFMECHPNIVLVSMAGARATPNTSIDESTSSNLS